MSIDRVRYLTASGALPGASAPVFLRTESAAQFVTQRGSRLSTSHTAVDRVIEMMHQRLDEPLTLPDMAAIAQLSPFHFNRMFRTVVGIPPVKFQAALRMQAAKRLLITTEISVTEICFMVGYNSVGTFTTSFTELVGVSPSQLRALAAHACMDYVRSLEPSMFWGSGEAPLRSGWTVQGTITPPELFRGLILVGLFNTALPENRPVACAIVSETNAYQINNVPRGTYHVLVAAFKPASTELTELLQDVPVLVGMARAPIATPASVAPIKANVRLRPTQSIDPPVLVALSVLLRQRLINLSSTRLSALAVSH